MKYTKFISLVVMMFMTIFSSVYASMPSTIVKGQRVVDLDQNGYPDAGYYYNGNFKSVNAWDAYGRYYYDTGTGQVYSNVASIDDLDPATRNIQEYNIEYRVDFGNGPNPVAGWVKQTILCKGSAYPHGNSVFVYLTVHRTDPRFTGQGLVYGDWQDFVLVWSRKGNIPRNWHW